MRAIKENEVYLYRSAVAKPTGKDAHVEVQAVHIVDNVAIEEGTFTGTQDGVLRGPMGDIPPTGRWVKVDYIQVLRFRDGKHVSFNLMFDQLTMLEQLGLLPTPAVAA